MKADLTEWLVLQDRGLPENLQEEAEAFNDRFSKLYKLKNNIISRQEHGRIGKETS